MLCVFSSLLYANRYYFFCNQLAKLLLLLWLVSSLCEHLDLIKTPFILEKKKNAHTTSVKDRTCGASNRFTIDQRICHLSLKMLTISTRQRIARHVVLSLTIQLMLVHVEYCGQPLLHTKLDFYLGGSINKRRHNCIMHLSVP
jgi:hypothetical protein